MRPAYHGRTHSVADDGTGVYVSTGTDEITGLVEALNAASTGVDSIDGGGGQLTGDVTLSAGSGLALVQAGQNIEVDAEPLRWIHILKQLDDDIPSAAAGDPVPAALNIQTSSSVGTNDLPSFGGYGTLNGGYTLGATLGNWTGDHFQVVAADTDVAFYLRTANGGGMYLLEISATVVPDVAIPDGPFGAWLQITETALNWNAGSVALPGKSIKYPMQQDAGALIAYDFKHSAFLWQRDTGSDVGFKIRIWQDTGMPTSPSFGPSAIEIRCVRISL